MKYRNSAELIVFLHATCNGFHSFLFRVLVTPGSSSMLGSHNQSRSEREGMGERGRGTVVCRNET